jgi:hypothetical protein
LFFHPPICLIIGHTTLFSKNPTNAMACNMWWGRRWTKFGGSNLEQKRVPNCLIGGVCYTTTCGIEAFDHTTSGTTYSWINCCKNNIDNFQDTLQQSMDLTLDAYIVVFVPKLTQIWLAKVFKSNHLLIKWNHSLYKTTYYTKLIKVNDISDVYNMKK